MSKDALAPEWEVSAWLGTDKPLSLAAFCGRPIVAAAFQMLCPGCVAHTIPQLNKVRELFGEDQVAVLGLHSVFEHHEAMREPSLRAFMHEYRIGFPVAIDRHEEGDPTPLTMRRYAFRGTPTLLLIDVEGKLRRQVFGHIPDLQLGAEIMALVHEADTSRLAGELVSEEGDRCERGGNAC